MAFLTCVKLARLSTGVESNAELTGQDRRLFMAGVPNKAELLSLGAKNFKKLLSNWNVW